MRNRVLMIISVVVFSILIVGCSEESNANEEDYSNYPEKPIELTIPYPAGGGTDVVARVLVEHINKHLPNNGEMVVINKEGGGGVVGTTGFKKESPDGYSVMMIPQSVLTLQPLIQEVTYEIDDFAPLAKFATIRQMLVIQEDADWETYEEWLKYVQDNPGKFSYGTTSSKSVQSLAMEMLNAELGVETKQVPFDGANPMKTSLQGGHIDGAVTAVYGSDKGTLKGLFSFSEEKGEHNGDVPLLADEAGIDINIDVIQSMFVPKDTPDEISEILNEAIVKTIEDPDFIEDFNKTELDLTYENAEELEESLAEQSERFIEAVEKTGMDQD